MLLCKDTVLCYYVFLKQKSAHYGQPWALFELDFHISCTGVLFMRLSFYAPQRFSIMRHY